MVLFELKVDFKKWEIILSENSISLTGNKDRPNACLSYMLYCLTIGKPFNLAYYIAKRMESVTKSDVMALPYGMLLTRLFEHVRTSHPYAITDLYDLVDHVMIPLSKKRDDLVHAFDQVVKRKNRIRNVLRSLLEVLEIWEPRLLQLVLCATKPVPLSQRNCSRQF
ncbi:hypothetical protein Tco_1142650 [Tanacetum coccineum]